MIHDEPPPIPPPSPFPPAEPRPVGGRGLAWLAWIVIAILVVVQLALPAVLDDGTISYDGDPTARVLMRLQGRYLVGAGGFAPREQLFQQAVMLDIGSVDQRLRFIVLAGEMSGPDAALSRLDALDGLIEEARDVEGFELTPETEQAQALLRRIYSTAIEGDAPDGGESPSSGGDVTPPYDDAVGTLTPEERALLVDQLDWFGELVTATSGDSRDAAMAPATRTFFLLIGVAVLAGLALFGGFAGLVTLLVLVLLGRLRGGLEPGRGSHGVYAETFALWLLTFIVAQSLAGLVAAALQLGTGASLAVVLVVFFGSLLTLAWPVVRGIPWPEVKTDIGWTRGRSFIVETLAGLAGYAMALPMLGVGMILTLLLIGLDALLRGGDVSPLAPQSGPSHPIVIELAGGSLGTFAIILLLASVAAPVVEETMFRGVLYRHLRDASRSYGRWMSVIGSTLLNTFVFAIIHPQGWVAVPVLMALATGFTLLREWRGTVWPAMVAHGVSNGIVMCMVALMLG